MPLSWPSWLSRASRVAGDSASPSIATGSPRSNSISITVASSGASSGEMVRWWTYSGASTAGSSSTFPSDEEWSRLASTEKGASPRLSLLIGIWCFSAKSINCSRLANSHSRHGAITLDVGLERIIAELEADLVVALAGGAVTDRVGADRARDLDLALGDQRPGDRGAEQILALVERVGAEHREDIVADELLPEVVDEDVLRLDAEQLGLGPRRLDLLALAEIGGEGDDLRADIRSAAI